MDVIASLEAPCAAERLFELIDDLSSYPQWNGLVHSAIAEPGDQQAWDVELRARLGPLARRPPSSADGGSVAASHLLSANSLIFWQG